MNSSPTAMSPVIVVLMATHDGSLHLDEQIGSILDQRAVEVRIIVSDDASTDGTAEVLERHARDPRVRVLQPGRFGSSRGNFLRLLREVDAAGADAVAFADQDDVWHRDKLARHAAHLADGADAVSGDVTAVFDHRRVVVRKSQPQRELDFVCESGGPGCTYLLSATTYRAIREVVLHDPRVDRAAQHDWLVYAIARSMGLDWRFDATPLVDYRQHGANVVGANVGVRAAIARARQLRSGAFRRDCAIVAEIAADVAPAPLAARLSRLAADLRTWDAAARGRVLRAMPSLRRRRRDRVALGAATVLRQW